MQPRKYYSMICADLNGKEIQRRGDTRVTDSLCSTVETNTTLQATIFQYSFFFLKKGLKQSGPRCVLHLVSLYRPPCPLHFSHRNPAAPHMSLLSAKLLTRTCLLHLPLYLRTSHLLSKGFPDDHHLKLDMHTCVHINCISQESRKILNCLGTV